MQTKVETWPKQILEKMGICVVEVQNVDGSPTTIFVAADYVIQVGVCHQTLRGCACCQCNVQRQRKGWESS
jgi:hypothetical protein